MCNVCTSLPALLRLVCRIGKVLHTYCISAFFILTCIYIIALCASLAGGGNKFNSVYWPKALPTLVHCPLVMTHLLPPAGAGGQ